MLDFSVGALLGALVGIAVFAWSVRGALGFYRRVNTVKLKVRKGLLTLRLRGLSALFADALLGKRSVSVVCPEQGPLTLEGDSLSLALRTGRLWTQDLLVSPNLRPWGDLLSVEDLWFVRQEAVAAAYDRWFGREASHQGAFLWAKIPAVAPGDPPPLLISQSSGEKVTCFDPELGVMSVFFLPITALRWLRSQGKVANCLRWMGVFLTTKASGGGLCDRAEHFEAMQIALCENRGRLIAAFKEGFEDAPAEVLTSLFPPGSPIAVAGALFAFWEAGEEKTKFLLWLEKKTGIAPVELANASHFGAVFANSLERIGK